MSDRFEQGLRDHLHREAARTRELPARLPGRIRRGIDSGGRFTPMQQLALAGAMVLFVALVGFLVVQLKGARNSQPASSSPNPSAFACGNRSGGNSQVSSDLRIVRVTPEGGFDRIVFEFDGPLPGYQIETANSLATTPGAGFARVSLLKVASPAAGIVTGVPEPQMIASVAQLSTSAQVTLFGINLAAPTCYRVSELHNPTRLVLDFPTGSRWNCGAVSGGQPNGGPYALTGIAVQPAGNAQTGTYDHLVFAFDSAVPIYDVIPQSSTTFWRYDGTTVALLGSSGIRLKFGNVRNTDLTKITWSMATTQPSPAKTSPTDFTPNLSVIKEVAVLDNSQGTIQFGIGVASGACFRVTDHGKALELDFSTTAARPVVPFQVRQLSFPDPLHGWALGTASKGAIAYLILAQTADGGANWRYLPLKDAGLANRAGETWHIFFENPNTGWLFGPAAYVTHDGGASWAPISLAGQIADLAAVDDSVWAATAKPSCTAPCPLELRRSTDGGQTWSVPSAVPRIVGPQAQIVRVSPEIGWILSFQGFQAGESSSLAVTHDGGATWQQLVAPCSPAASFNDRMAAFDDRQIWVACGSETGARTQQKQLITSSDGGLHWSYAPNPPTRGELSSLALSAPTTGLTGWLATARGPLYVTTDGGQTWNSAQSRGVAVNPAGSGAVDVVFVDPRHGWAAATDEIFRTADGGQHWVGVPAQALEDTFIYQQSTVTARSGPSQPTP